MRSLRAGSLCGQASWLRQRSVLRDGVLERSSITSIRGNGGSPESCFFTSLKAGEYFMCPELRGGLSKADVDPVRRIALPDHLAVSVARRRDAPSKEVIRIESKAASHPVADSRESGCSREGNDPSRGRTSQKVFQFPSGCSSALYTMNPVSHRASLFLHRKPGHSEGPCCSMVSTPAPSLLSPSPDIDIEPVPCQLECKLQGKHDLIRLEPG